MQHGLHGLEDVHQDDGLAHQSVVRLELHGVHVEVSEVGRQEQHDCVRQHHPGLPVVLHVVFVDGEKPRFPEQERVQHPFQEQSRGHIVKLTIIPRNNTGGTLGRSTRKYW